MLQSSTVSFRYIEIRVLNFGSTPLHLRLKSTNENRNFFRLSIFGFFLLNLYCKYKASAAKTFAECFSGSLKITKKVCGKN